MASNLYSGVGVNLTSDFYKRNFYISNRDAQTSSKRSSMDKNTLSYADGMALRQAVRQLGDFTFSEDEDANIRNSVLAYIDTYNNTLSSCGKSTDSTLTRNAKQLKALTKEYTNELDKIGITVNEDGTLTSRDSLFKTADLSKFKKIFSSDSTYMQRTSAYAKRIAQRSDELSLSEKNKAIRETKKAAETITDTLTETGIGQNVNISV